MRNHGNIDEGTHGLKAFGTALLGSGAHWLRAGGQWLDHKRHQLETGNTSTPPSGPTSSDAMHGDGDPEIAREHVRRTQRATRPQPPPSQPHNAVDWLSDSPDFGHFGAYDQRGRAGRVVDTDQDPPATRPRGCRGLGPKGYTRPDARILEDICEQLMADDSVDAREVTVEVHQGIVQLHGEVPARWVKHHIESICERCSGVHDIENRLRVPGTQASQPAAPSLVAQGARDPAPAGASAQTSLHSEAPKPG